MARKVVVAGLAAATTMLLAPMTAVHAAALSTGDANSSIAVSPANPVAEGCTTPPQPPTNVRASGGFSPTMIGLTWIIVPPADGCTLAGFDILRATGTSG